MINSLIQPPKAQNKPVMQNVPTTATTAQNAARLFVNSMGEAQRERFKAMLDSGAEVGMSVAQSYGVPLEEFIAEVRKII